MYGVVQGLLTQNDSVDRSTWSLNVNLRVTRLQRAPSAETVKGLEGVRERAILLYDQ
jgi:hypothetical protein